MAAAVCTLISVTAATLTGTLLFTQQDNGAIKVTGKITGLSPGKHGFHVHEFGDTGNKCVAAGSHFNPQGQTHGAPADTVRHVGDLGNIVANDEGGAQVDITDRLIAFSGTHDIVGRSVVVHAKEDDLGRGGNEGSLATGNAGARLACCVIQATRTSSTPALRPGIVWPMIPWPLTFWPKVAWPKTFWPQLFPKGVILPQHPNNQG
ncbi:Superoxide dismutase [Cu-Zn] [Nucella lapillus]